MAGRAIQLARLHHAFGFPPGLLAEGGEALLGRQVAVVVPEHHPQVVPLGLDQGHGGVVAVGRLADLRQGQPLKRAQDDAHGRAVGENGHRLAVMLPGHPAQGRQIPVQHGLGSLTALHLPAVQLVVELHHLQGPAGLDLAPGQALPHAHVHLPEGGLQVQGQALGDINRLGGGLGADQVAGVYGVHRDVPEPPGQGLHLAGAAIVGDQAFLLAVGDAIEIALGLGVADEIDFRHSKPSLTAR